MESDADYRQRIPAAFEGMSVAGPTARMNITPELGWAGG
jgi:phage-related baseplate assembly protein